MSRVPWRFLVMAASLPLCLAVLRCAERAATPLPIIDQEQNLETLCRAAGGIPDTAVRGFCHDTAKEEP